MGRGRAKAKQAKVARRLKYEVPNTDLDSLQRELASQNNSARHDSADTDDDYDYSDYDDYSDYSKWNDDEWDDSDKSSRR